MLRHFNSWISPGLGIDLGTANTLIAVLGSGIVVNEPSVVALARDSRRILGRGTAVGKLARQMLGRTPDTISAVRPLSEGVITDFKLCEAMLKYFVRKATGGKHLLRPKTVIAVPGRISPVEKRAVFHSAERSGAGKVYLIEEARAAAIGAGMPISEPIASMICDLGGGTTEAAVLSLGDIVVSKSSRVAGEHFDHAIVEYLRRQYSLKIGLQTAERVKMELGSAWRLPQEDALEVRGLDLVSGVPRKAIVTSEEIREVLVRILEEIAACLRETIEQCPPELISDLAQTGVVLTGGGALLRGVDQYLSEFLGIPVRIDDDPTTTAARGTAICLEHLNQWKHVLMSDSGNL
ncbi:rod shape-determining protein [Rubinisphaera italica]|uniref:Cell shape-determining protein MreB n=1 Tax=Rubinisphaera italica TaxID=2527969 RepID=A0A5C5XPS3_9PLAN|nr:rod shape-determining protein [Rubinisphaera italica]TWT64471.1 Rod shape-determining protein MreB [Rubinisphaera italica]